ncbi:DUF6363 domain-containing protein [Vibrio sp. SCSIO 43136]|uniref:patatin-like phospholipase family protein n=1 Tax=Vibrio sp. SCSIO 43136 TaxID=2819101 RepID=UPI002075437A|nr:DUF6363 domain-containing protein [Vibrio sp. SCSIO 43136]USD64400.1 patatin-like phospholipase family protein [Vibrio sp. SCSIO 43136]
MVNNGLVTEQSAQLDDTRFRHYLSGKTSLVAQGGGQRSIFTAGVLDAFLYANFDPFHSFYGTSAGALNLTAYLCRQAELGKAFLLDLTTQKEFFHTLSYIRRKQPMGLDWALEKVCHYPYKLDLDMGQRVLGDREAYASVTDVVHLRDQYLPIFTPHWKEVLTATCAIPRLYDKPVSIDGIEYYDGGISASVPAQQAWRQEARLIVVIRTESIGENLPQDVAPSEQTPTLPVWLREPVSTIQEKWDLQVERWKQEWTGFLKGQFEKSLPKQKLAKSLSLDGGRWLFGSGDVYRLSHLLGEHFDSGLADMLMVHYQTYALTQQFLNNPPDDCFVVQICPKTPLQSTPLLSEPEALLHDYQLGFEAGNQFVKAFQSPLEQRQKSAS